MGVCLQSHSEQQLLKSEMCRLEKEVTSLEQIKRDLTSKKAGSDQVIQSHNAVVAGLQKQLDNTNAEKV